MSIKTCPICGNQYDQDTHVEHEEICGELDRKFNNPLEQVDKLVNLADILEKALIEETKPIRNKDLAVERQTEEDNDIGWDAFEAEQERKMEENQLCRDVGNVGYIN